MFERLYGNHVDDDGVMRYCGYTVEEATRAAVEANDYEAYYWLQAWWNADLKPEQFLLEDWL